MGCQHCEDGLIVTIVNGASRGKGVTITYCDCEEGRERELAAHR